MKNKPNYWLFKSEPDVFSIAHLAARLGKTGPWDGVRNYQARNFLRSTLPGDIVLFHHSSCSEPGIAGIAEVVGPARPDPTQFDPKSDFYDKGSKPDAPRWWLVDVRYVATFPRFVSLAAMRATPALHKMRLLAPGNRLSVFPVTPADYKVILRMGGMH